MLSHCGALLELNGLLTGKCIGDAKVPPQWQAALRETQEGLKQAKEEEGGGSGGGASGSSGARSASGDAAGPGPPPGYGAASGAAGGAAAAAPRVPARRAGYALNWSPASAAAAAAGEDEASTALLRARVQRYLQQTSCIVK